MFGTQLSVSSASSALGFDLASVAGLKQAQLIGEGQVLRTQSFTNAPRESHVEFALPLPHARWYALLVEDQRGRKAYSDAIWSEASHP